MVPVLNEPALATDNEAVPPVEFVSEILPVEIFDCQVTLIDSVELPLLLPELSPVAALIPPVMV